LEAFALQALTGLASASSLFLVASGLTVIFGVVPLPAFSVSVLPMVPPLEISHEPVLLVVVSPNERLPSV
jgi:hypothetical protein